MANDNLRRDGWYERDFKVQRGVYAIGLIVLPDRLVPTMRTTLDEMEGMDWVAIPYPLAKSLHDSIELYIIRKGVKTGGQRLIELNNKEGYLKVTPFGEIVLKKLGNSLDKRKAPVRN